MLFLAHSGNAKLFWALFFLEGTLMTQGYSKSSVSYVSLVSIIAALAGLLFGFDTGIISGALLFIPKTFPISTAMQEAIVGSVLFGAMFGSLSSGKLTDTIGRKRTMLVTASFFIIGTLLATFADSINAILIGRCIIGVAIGIGSYTAPLYIAEIAPFHMRGQLVTLNQLAITLGIFLSYVINYAFIQIEGSWRFMFAIGIIPAVLLALGMILLPESPRWLVTQNKIEPAIRILQKLRHSNNVLPEIHDIKSTQHIKQTSIKQIFSAPIFPVLSLGIMLGLIQQVTGINTIIYYAPTIFQLAGFESTTTAIAATIGIGLVNVIATLFAVFYLDRIGRRPLLFTGLLGMTVSLIGLSLAFYLQLEITKWLAVACTFLYIISFAFSLGAILWLVVSEIFPLQVRATAMGFAVFSCWFWNFVVSSTFLTLLANIGPALTFMFYASMCILSLVYCYFFVPETKGVTLEEIERNIHKQLPLREIGQPLYSTSPLID